MFETFTCVTWPAATNVASPHSRSSCTIDSFGGELTLLADYARTIAANIEAVPDFHWEVQDLVTDGNLVAVRLEDSGTPHANWLGIAPSGRAITFQEFAFYRFQDGKIAEIWFLVDVRSIQSQLQPSPANAE